MLFVLPRLILLSNLCQKISHGIKTYLKCPAITKPVANPFPRHTAGLYFLNSLTVSSGHIVDGVLANGTQVEMTYTLFYLPCSFSFYQLNVDKPSNPRNYMLRMVDPQDGRIWISKLIFRAEWITNRKHLFLTFDDWLFNFCYVWSIIYMGIRNSIILTNTTLVLLPQSIQSNPSWSAQGSLCI